MKPKSRYRSPGFARQEQLNNSNIIFKFITAVGFFMGVFTSKSVVMAQQSYFNVPSSERTKLQTRFFQNQTDLPHSGEWKNNSTFDFPVSENLEAGFNILDVSTKTFNAANHPSTFVLNGQYFWKLPDRWQLSLGSQQGLSIMERTEISSYSYLNCRRDWASGASVVLGFFTANRTRLEQGTGNWHVGAEIPTPLNGLHFVGDYIDGDSEISISVLGLSHHLTRSTILSLGCQLPSFRSANREGLVVELTATNW